MVDDTVLSFGFPAVGRKKVTAAFDGGRLTSDGGVMLLSLAEKRLGIADRLARLIPDRRDPTRITHSFADMIRARIFAICCGYEDADDLDCAFRGSWAVISRHGGQRFHAIMGSSSLTDGGYGVRGSGWRQGTACRRSCACFLRSSRGDGRCG